MIHKTSISFILILACAFGSTLSAQDSKVEPDKIMGRIVGTWKVQKILSGTKEVARNPTSGQWIEFKSDGKYLNHSTSLDSGSFRADENQSILYLESSVHAGTSKNSRKEIGEWSVTFDGDTMILQRKNKKQHADKMKYFYVRISGEESALKSER